MSDIDSSNNCTKQRPKSERLSFVNSLISSVITPNVLTVIITALCAPFVTWIISCSIEQEKTRAQEAIEKNKLQMTILEDVLKHTSESDMGDISHVIRLGLIAQMVMDNKLVLNIDLSNSIERLAALTEAMKAHSTTSFKDQIDLLRQQKAEYADKVNINLISIGELEQRIGENRAFLEESSDKERKSLEEQIAAAQSELDGLKIQNDQYSKKENELAGKLQTLQLQLNKTTAELQSMTEDNIKLIEDSKRHEEALNDPSISIEDYKVKCGELIGKLEETSISLNTMKEIVDNKNKDINKLKTDYHSVLYTEGKKYYEIKEFSASKKYLVVARRIQVQMAYDDNDADVISTISMLNDIGKWEISQENNVIQ